ncbi:cobyric acid synthase [Aliikangiella marina]|uniref:Cobyric acid synthase n=1 Tax=Aliikangiella marina TaxID=1712262 RepID=A0A545TCQ5_9GAMM|nr:cobyric acid synthase [Aliikangiella marina]TQV74995.1 cobyric acid synthase [Aliikangiella marina]
MKGSLMIQGTTSDAGKSLCVAGLCRLFARKGISVAPFKPQNMALNSAVTQDGGEIGRAQALQADACGLDYSTDFNPVLLKPNSDLGSQVIVQGKAVASLPSETFGDIKSIAFEAVLESYHRLKEQFDLVLIEGAGSPAEINLRKNDIANMGFAEAVDCPVVLIGDINKGGVFAHLTGTLNLLSASEQQRVKGFIINQFRGHLNLLQGGLDWLTKNTGKPVFGVVPYIPELKLDEEDAIDSSQSINEAQVVIKIPVLSRISNHTDFDPLRWHPKIDLQFVAPGESLENCDLILLPGTKNVRDDLDFMRAQGWCDQIKKHLRYGGKVLGICGGYQMLGESISDPLGVESQAGVSQGLGLLQVTTELRASKKLTQVSGKSFLCHKNTTISGYEIHCGISTVAGDEKPFAELSSLNQSAVYDGCISTDNQVAGTYLHGLFESGEIVQVLVEWVSGEIISAGDWRQVREQEIDRLADVFEESLDIDALVACIG